VIVKGHQQLEAAQAAVTRAEVREELIELWAQIFERELRADLEVVTERTEPPATSVAKHRGER
jgi:hypothetical protein